MTPKLCPAYVLLLRKENRSNLSSEVADSRLSLPLQVNPLSAFLAALLLPGDSPPCERRRHSGLYIKTASEQTQVAMKKFKEALTDNKRLGGLCR